MQNKLAKIVIEVGKEVNKRKKNLIKKNQWDGDQLKTEADIFAHKLLVHKLLKLIKIPIISEEDSKSHLILRPKKYWIIDPIDGTRSFADGYPGWVTQVALVEFGVVLNAAIYAPDLDLLYLAEKGKGSTLNGNQLIVKESCEGQVRLIDNYPNPKGIAEKIMSELPCKEYIESGGISLKICRVADGTADLFVKDVAVRDWDVAAPMLVLKEAGGILKKGDGSKFLLSSNFDKNGLIASNSRIVVQSSMTIMGNSDLINLDIS